MQKKGITEKEIHLYKMLVRIAKLIPKKEQRKLLLFSLIQIFANILDLLALLIVSLIISYGEKQFETKNTLNIFGNNIVEVSTFLSKPKNLPLSITVVLVLFLGKSLINIFLNKKIFDLLAEISLKSSNFILKSLVYGKNKDQDELRMSDIIYALSDGIPRIFFLVIGSAINLFSDIVLLLLLLTSLCLFDLPMSFFIMFVFGSFFYLAFKVSGQKTTRYGQSATKNNLEANNFVFNFIRNRKELIVRGNHRSLIDIYEKKRKIQLNSLKKLIFMQSTSRYILEFAIPIGAFIIFIIRNFSERFFQSPSSLIVFLVAGSRLVPALLKINSNSILISSIIGEVNNVSKVLFKPEEIAFRDQNIGLEINTEREVNIEFRKVCFKYNDDQDFLLNNVNFNINYGRIFAVVGASGSGKTTLIDLALGILEPTLGEVLISGLPPKKFIDFHPGKIAYVPQDPMIIGGTVRENLQFGNQHSEFNDEDLWKVLRQVQLDQLVGKYNGGLDCQILEFGNSLSGGQRQRLGLARGLMSNPHLIFLDEVTSALDDNSEDVIKSLLESFRGKKTVIISTHSSKLTSIADEIFTITN